MKYLFFDIENATCKGGHKICEFGYVITNEEFEVLDKRNFIINPNISRSDWDWYVVKNILTRKIREYENSLTFNYFYDDIVNVFSDVDYVFGHSLANDAQALNDECKRYNLPSIDFKFYDIKKMYQEYEATKKEVSLNQIKENLDIICEGNQHDALADSLCVVYELKAMLEYLNVSVDDMIELCPSSKDENSNLRVQSYEYISTKREENIENIMNGKCGNDLKKNSLQHKLFLQFKDNVKPTSFDHSLKDLKFSISMNYEEKHFKEMLNIVQLLCNKGAKYTNSASSSDFFVSVDLFDEDGNLRKCSRLCHVNEAIEKGANIKIITFDEFLKLLNITEKELNNLPMVSFDCLYRDDAEIKDRKMKHFFKKKNNVEIINTDATVSIGELLPELAKMYKEE